MIIENVSVSFGGVQALCDVSAEIPDSVVGVIGPNGAGKTTLLNVFSGFVQPDSGRLEAFGTDLLEMPPHQRARWGLRRSFQTEQVVDDLSVAHNVLVMLDPFPLSRAEKAASTAEALAFVGLSGKSDAAPLTLNTFERRMVELAKTLVGAPKLILLDEPGAGLGEQEVSELERIIKEIPRRFRATTLLIDHDVELIVATCSSTLVLDFGTLIAYGQTAQVLKDPRVRAAYLGDENVVR
ncbi:MAG: ATP-binding cassette domain-containing protein [Burkholderiales bacterium]